MLVSASRQRITTRVSGVFDSDAFEGFFTSTAREAARSVVMDVTFVKGIKSNDGRDARYFLSLSEGDGFR